MGSCPWLRQPARVFQSPQSVPPPPPPSISPHAAAGLLPRGHGQLCLVPPRLLPLLLPPSPRGTRHWGSPEGQRSLLLCGGRPGVCSGEGSSVAGVGGGEEWGGQEDGHQRVTTYLGYQSVGVSRAFTSDPSLPACIIGLSAASRLPPCLQALRFVADMPTISKSARVVLVPNPRDPAALPSLLETLVLAAGDLAETSPRQQVSGGRKAEGQGPDSR